MLVSIGLLTYIWNINAVSMLRLSPATKTMTGLAVKLAMHVPKALSRYKRGNTRDTGDPNMEASPSSLSEGFR
jgi:hypothetical protein